MPKNKKSQSSTAHFGGFDTPQSNWFKMPYSWTDLTAGMKSLAEVKVVEYILRHTWGFQEYGISKHITTDEFMYGRKRQDGTRMDKGTGLSKQGVITALQLAVEHGFIEEEIDNTDRARIKKFYCLRMRDNESSDLDVKSFDIGVKDFDSSGQNFRHRTEKETLERLNNSGSSGLAGSPNWLCRIRKTLMSSPCF